MKLELEPVLPKKSGSSRLRDKSAFFRPRYTGLGLHDMP